MDLKIYRTKVPQAAAPWRLYSYFLEHEIEICRIECYLSMGRPRRRRRRRLGRALSVRVPTAPAGGRGQDMTIHDSLS